MKKCLLILLCLAAALVVCGCETEGTNGAEQSSAASDGFLGVYEDPAAGIVVLEYTNGGLLKEYPVQGEELILPATYAKGEIVGVADEAFCELESLVSVTIPDGYTYIGASAFRDCPDLETVHIGKDVEEIGVWAFNGCKKLLGLEVSRANVHFYSVKGCLLTKQTNVLLYSSGYMPEETKVIQAGACANKIQTSWKLPAGLQEICSEAFSGGLMEVLILPDGVTVIGDKAFAHCKNLKRVYIPATVTKAGQDLFAGIDHELTVYCQAEVQPVDWAANWLQGNDAADVSWGYHSDPLRLQKRSADNPIQNTHVTPEKLWWYQDCEAYHRTGTSPVYIHVLDMEVFYYVDDSGNVGYDRDADPQCRKAGMKVWVCTPEGEKIDYVYTNSDGVAKFECSPGEYLFLLEKGEFEEKAIGPVTCKQTFSRGSYPYSNSKDYPFPIIAYRGEREDFKVRVIDTETKKPIVGAEVEVQGVGTLTTGEDGYAVFDPLVQFADSWGDTNYLVTCGARGYDERGGEWVQLYDAEFVMELEANAITEYKITILDKKTGKPVEGIKVIEYGNNWHEDSKLFNKVTGEDGTIYGQFTSADLHYGFVRSIRLEYTGEYLLEDGSIVVNKDQGEIRLEKGKTEYILYLERNVRDATLREKKD